MKNRDGALRPFKVSRRATFLAPHENGEAGSGSGSPVFRSTERQQIIDYLVRSKIKDGGAELDEDTALGKHIVSRFPLHMQVTRLSRLLSGPCLGPYLGPYLTSSAASPSTCR